jgi:hypothetical protein
MGEKNIWQSISQPVCHKSKNLYNYVNYILRQTIANKLENIPEYSDLVASKKKVVKKNDGTE